jgi:hypothetical protein
MSTLIHQARQAERDGRVADAFSFYLKAYQIGELVDYEDAINAAVLFFQASDYGFCSAHGLSQDASIVGWNACRGCIETARVRASAPSEIAEAEFWERYFPFAALGDAPFESRAFELLRHSLVPVIHLISDRSSPALVQKARELYATVVPCRNERDRYIASTLARYLVNARPSAS